MILVLSFHSTLSWWGWDCFFSWAAHCTPPHPTLHLPHPSQCLCKPPRSYTWSLMPAQAKAPPRFVLLTRTVMSLWPPQAAAWRSAEAQGLEREGLDKEKV